MAAVVRWLSLLVFLAASLPLGGQFSARWAKETGVFESHGEFLAIGASLSLTIVQHPWFYWVLIGLASFAAGTWIESFAKKSDQLRRRRSLGRKLVSLGRRIENAQSDHSKWPHNILHIRADLRSALLRSSQLGIWVPDHTTLLQRDANVLVTYLTVIGTLLDEGRLTEAIDDSLRCRDLIRAERAKLRAGNSAQSVRRPREYFQAASARY